MTNEQQKAKELAELLNAFSEGKQIEWFNQSKWIDIRIGCLLRDLLIDYGVGIPFRIKPETKRIALNQQDLIDRELSGETMRAKYGYGYCIVTDYNENNVFLADEKLTYEEFSKLEWLNSSPCYKEVDCE